MIFKVVPFFLSAFFFLFYTCAYAQNINTDEGIISRYALQPADTVPHPQKQNLFLVKLKQGDTVFSKSYKNLIVLNPAACWFIIKADTLPQQFFQQVFPAGNNYKLNTSFFVNKCANLKWHKDYL